MLPSAPYDARCASSVVGDCGRPSCRARRARRARRTLLSNVEYTGHEDSTLSGHDITLWFLVHPTRVRELVPVKNSQVRAREHVCVFVGEDFAHHVADVQDQTRERRRRNARRGCSGMCFSQSGEKLCSVQVNRQDDKSGFPFP